MDQPGHPPLAGLSRPPSYPYVDGGLPTGGDQTVSMPGTPSGPYRRTQRSNRASWAAEGGPFTDDPSADETGSSASVQRSLFLQEYNRLAAKHALGPLQLAETGSGDPDFPTTLDGQPDDRRSWFARTFGKPSVPAQRRASRQSTGLRSEKGGKHRRSDSDPANQRKASHSSRSDAVDTLKNQTLQTLVRTCGKSYLYLPGEYATRSLMLPTCFRAAAQYLVQHGPEARGIFRISGSMRVVNELYDYYCVNLDDDGDIAATVRSPNLPFHIKASVHDVASMFKRLLAGLPGGILGYLELFEAFIGIQGIERRPINDDNGSGTNTSSADQANTRARLIALAIGSIPSPLQRELICAVFGMLSLFGYTAETAPSQATLGGTLPHSEQMGYAALGIIFGPLLVGNYLDAYSPESAGDGAVPSSPFAGPTPSNTSSPRSKADKRRKSVASDKNPQPSFPSALDKILLANGVAELLIANWRNVVHQMKQMGIMRKESMSQHTAQPRSQPPNRTLRPSRSETFADYDMGAMVQQASQPYSSNLRKTRSASNHRSPGNATSAKQPNSNLPSQRPADMTFEEFAARKRLRNYASNISIASDSTYSAIEPQPVRPLSPPTEDDPFFIPDQKTTVVRSIATKLTKQRRGSSGVSSMLGEKSSSPVKGSPKTPRIPRKPVQVHEGASGLTPEDGGKPVASQHVPLTPVKAKGPPIHEIGSNIKTPASPTKHTPRPADHQNKAIHSCQSEPPGRVGLGCTPQSRTAALIAKIMNTRQQTSPVHPKKTKTAPGLCAGEGSGNNMSREITTGTPRMEPVRIVPDSPDGRQKAPNANTLGNGGRRTQKDDRAVSNAAARTTTNGENQPLDAFVPATPTAKRQWKAQATTGSVDAHDGAALTVNDSNRSPTLRAGHRSEGRRRHRPELRRDQSDSHPMTPQRNPQYDRSSAGDSRHFLLAKPEGKPFMGTRGQDDISILEVPASPLSEIKNDARGLAMPPLRYTDTIAASKATSKPAQDDFRDHTEARPPIAGSSVKAMAALFDSAAWKDSPETSPTAQTQSARSRGAPTLTFNLSPYKRNASPSRLQEPVTPERIPDRDRLGDGGKDETKEGHSASLQRTTSERRRLHLSRSEDKTSRPFRIGRFGGNGRREWTRSVDRSDADDIARQKPPYSEKHKTAPSGAARRRETRGRSGEADQHQTPHSPSLRASEGTAQRRRQDSAVPSQPIEPTTSPLEPIATTLSSDVSSSVQELQRLLQSKSRECRRWKAKAEEAEKRVAELELILAGSGSHGAKKSELLATASRRCHRQSWPWLDMSPTTEPGRLTGGKAPSSNGIQRVGDAPPAYRPTEPQLLKGAGMNDSNASESSATTVVVNGRLSHEKRLLFST